jgi:hypothetical protein
MLDALLIAGLVMVFAPTVLILILVVLKRIAPAVAELHPNTASSTLPETLPMADEPRNALSDISVDDVAGNKFDADCTAPEIAVVHEIPVDVSDFVITAFQPGTDSCRVWLRGADIEFDVHAIAAGIVLEIRDAKERLTITFQGVKRLPFEDIVTVFDCPVSGRQVQPLPGSGGRESAKVSAEAIVDAEWRLAAWAEAERAVEAFDNPVHGVANGGHSHLLPTFEGFDADAEYIEVWVPNVSECDLQVEVVPARGGRHGLILIAGRPTALLQGAADASARNVRFVPMTAKAA